MKNTDNIEKCSCTVIHDDVIQEVKSKLPKEEVLYDLAEFFKVFGDSTRIKIICALFESEMCVCDLAALFGMTQSAISHQLRTLKTSRLVRYRREGKVIYYSLDDEHIKHVFDEGLRHVTE
ncbi:MAG: metalloregulator ArsR/SmtB family transcription factor [Clostridium sp.]